MFYSTKLKKIKSIQHYFFSRKNGYSSGLYESLNCGFGSNDKVDNILKNLEFVSKQFNIEKKNLKLMNQTHSNKVIFVDSSNKNKEKFNSDALVTKEKNLVLGVLTADCVPLLIHDKKRKMIAAIHAGWKGAYKGIIQKVIKFMFSKGCSPNDMTVAIGPSIAMKNYEIKEEFKNKFVKKNKKNLNFFVFKKDKIYFNLPNYVKTQVKLCKIKNIDILNIDTFNKKNNFFSARRSLKLKHDDYGRNISIIMIK